MRNDASRDNMDAPIRFLIRGEWRDGVGRFEVINPHSGKPVTHAPVASRPGYDGKKLVIFNC